MRELEWFDVRAACWRVVRWGCVGVAFLRSAIVFRQFLQRRMGNPDLLLAGRVGSCPRLPPKNWNLTPVTSGAFPPFTGLAWVVSVLAMESIAACAYSMLASARFDG